MLENFKHVYSFNHIRQKWMNTLILEAEVSEKSEIIRIPFCVKAPYKIFKM